MPQRVRKNVPRPFKRTGTHRINCTSTGCDAYLYATVATLEKHGFPVCACGSTYEAERLELALMLGVDHPAAVQLDDMTRRKLNAQRPHTAKPCVMSDDLASYGELQDRALSEISAAQRQTSRERRLAAITPTTDPIPF